MKKSLILLSLTASAAAVATVTFGPTDVRGWQSVNGRTSVGSPHPTEAACRAAIVADVDSKEKSANTKCVLTHAYRAEWSPTVSTPTPTATVPTPTPTTPPATTTAGDFWQLGDMPRVDTSTLPAPATGYSDARLRADNQGPLPNSDIGEFRTTCLFSHMNFDDGIVFPGRVGASHLHAYFGNTGSNANSTAESLRTTGNSTCQGGILNRSSYWVPTMVHHTTGRVIAPRSLVVYYKTGYSQMTAAEMQPLPPGLRMIAGTSSATAPAPRASWESAPRVFECEATGVTTETIPACPANTEMAMVVGFPQCWDGVNLDSPDHKSHLAYRGGGRCPASHPMAIPEITFTVRWPTGTAGAAGWRLSSDNYQYNGSNAGYSVHADWFNGWNEGTSNAWHQNCIRAMKDCGVDRIGGGYVLN